MSFTRQVTIPSKLLQLTCVPGAYCTMTGICCVPVYPCNSGDSLGLVVAAEATDTVAIKNRIRHFFMFPPTKSPKCVTRPLVTLIGAGGRPNVIGITLSYERLTERCCGIQRALCPTTGPWDKLSRRARDPAWFLAVEN